MSPIDFHRPVTPNLGILGEKIPNGMSMDGDICWLTPSFPSAGEYQSVVAFQEPRTLDWPHSCVPALSLAAFTQPIKHGSAFT